jgi:prepilin-type N-terminal cleavage/methylation domain-containing protein
MRNSFRYSFARRSGHTLLEMVVVLAILALMWGMASPRYFAATARYRAEAAARRIAADLNLARAQAIQSSANVVVSFNTAANTYTLNGVQSLDRQSNNYTVNLAIDPYQASLVTVPFASSQVTFSAYGSADQSGTLSVTSGGIQWNVTLEATAGKVTVAAQ